MKLLHADALDRDSGRTTLVQAGTFTKTPEFATGTMAVQSSTLVNTNFSMNGPYLDFKLTLIECLVNIKSSDLLIPQWGVGSVLMSISLAIANSVNIGRGRHF